MACKNGLQHSHLSDTQLTAKNSTLIICGNHFQMKQLPKLLQANDHDNGYFHFNKFRNSETLKLDSNPESLSSQTNTQPFGQMVECSFTN